MDVALCYPSVLPGRGGCETYIADLSHRLARDGHRVHLYANTWDAAALPASVHYHRIDAANGPRFLRPWRFAAACKAALDRDRPALSMGFDKTYGQDILYPQGGLHVATAWHNRLKFSSQWGRRLASLGKSVDLANWSFRFLERKQYFSAVRPIVVVNSEMVRGHFEKFYGVPPEGVRVLRSAIDLARFAADDRLARRHKLRSRWTVTPETPVGLFIGVNYRLKGLEPLLRALPAKAQLAVAGNQNFSKFAKLAAALGVADRVRFLGHCRDPRDLYFAADYLVHPTFYDPCSLVALEALACGLPVVTTQYNGAAELLNETNGVVVNDPHNREELAAAIDHVSDHSFLRTAGSAARAAASKWTFEHHYQGLLQIFTEKQSIRRAA